MSLIHRVTGFNPLRVPGCALWLEADRRITLDGSSNVSAWADQSGNGRHFTQTTPTARPAHMQNANAGRPAVIGDGIDDCLINAAFPMSGSFTLLCGLIRLSANVDSAVYAHGSRWNDGAAMFMGATNAIWVTRNNAITLWNSTEAVKTDGYHIYRHEHGGTDLSHKKWTDGVDVTGAATLNNDVGTESKISAFSLLSSSDTFAGCGIQFLVLYSPQLSSEAAAYLERGFGRKYGIAVA